MSFLCEFISFASQVQSLNTLVTDGEPPTWTNKEVLQVIGGTLAVVLPLCALLIKILNRDLHQRVKVAEDTVQKLKSISNGHIPRDDPSITPDLQLDLAVTDNGATDWQKEFTESEKQLISTQEELTSLQGSIGDHITEASRLRKRIHRALCQDGQIWLEPLFGKIPEFVPLHEEKRRTPVISVLNLKGGVGKTTTTANLTAAFDGLGYRVLMLDLDLQGSLTGVFQSDDQQVRSANSRRRIEDFLLGCYDPSGDDDLADYVRPACHLRHSGIIPTADTLAHTEMNLTIRWVLRERRIDPRFFLRRGLRPLVEWNTKKSKCAYDIVLIDCPPLISLSCVNALAVSDYLLIPTMPSRLVTARVPVLLKRIKQFREVLNHPNLHVRGILANRTHGTSLTAEESNLLDALPAQCLDAWGVAIPRLRTTVRRSSQFGLAESDRRPLCAGDSMYSVFVDLAKEVASAFPTFCGPRGEASCAGGK